MKSRLVSPRNLKIYYAVQFLQSLIFTIAIIIVFFQLHLDAVQISLLYSFRMLIIVLAELPTGAVADMVGKKWSMIIGLFLSALASLILPFTQSFSQIIFAYAFILPLGESFLSGATEAMVFDSLKQDGLENQFSKIRINENLIFQVGLIISSFLSGFMYQYNFYLPFVLTAFMSTLATILCFFIIEPKIDTETFTLKNYIKQIKLGSKEIFKNSHISQLSIFYIVVGGITWATTLYFNKYLLVELGFSDVNRGIIDSVVRIFNVFILTSLLRNEKLFTRARSILFFPILMTVSFLPGVLLHKWDAMPFVTGVTMASSARWAILGQMTNEHFESKYRSTAISTLSMAISFFYIILTLISGPIISNFNVRTMYTLMGVMSLLIVGPLALKLARIERLEMRDKRS